MEVNEVPAQIQTSEITIIADATFGKLFVFVQMSLREISDSCFVFVYKTHVGVNVRMR